MLVHVSVRIAGLTHQLQSCSHMTSSAVRVLCQRSERHLHNNAGPASPMGASSRGAYAWAAAQRRRLARKNHQPNDWQEFATFSIHGTYPCSVL